MSGRNKSRRSAERDGYHWSKFRYDESAAEYICPEGKRLRFKGSQQQSVGKDRYFFVASREDCQACPKRQACCPTTNFTKHGRSVSIDLAHPAVDQFEAKMQTSEAMAIYKQRAPVAEFPNAWIKTKLAFRQFRCRGLKNVQSEAIWAALTYNLQRMFKLQTAIA